MEMRLTLSAIASFITTREAASPMADSWIKERLEYVEAKLEAVNKEMV
ncbi:hypothetical protein [Aulosira sp. FACHB-615]|nr:hypothetical protein [Aulosira sp. FACHB-615]MBD2488988.1 hypothetical protein [Aulosira sp. FACHB-615]